MQRAVRLSLTAVVLLVCGAAIILIIIFQGMPDFRCVRLIEESVGDVKIALPANCALTPKADADEMVKYLERERATRNLVFRDLIICKGTPGEGFSFLNDHRWMPSYVPETYQFRRTVVILPYAQPVPKGSPVVAEVCRMPWRRYIRLVAGQCHTKFLVWQ